MKPALLLLWLSSLPALAQNEPAEAKPGDEPPAQVEPQPPAPNPRHRGPPAHKHRGAVASSSAPAPVDPPESTPDPDDAAPAEPSPTEVRPFTGDQGFGISFGNAWRVAPILFTDVDFRVYPSDVEGGYTGFTLARARAGVRLSLFDRVDAVLIGLWEGDAPHIFEAHITAHLPAGFFFEAGYARSVLFITGRDELDSWQPLQERPMVSDAFWPGRELGALVGWRGVSPLEMWLRVSNGTDNFAVNDNMTPALEARVDFVLGRQRKQPDSFWGLRIGAAVHWDPNAFDRVGITGNTVGDYVFWRAPVVSGQRMISEGHMAYDVGPVELRVEGAYATESRSKDTDGDPATPRDILPTVISYGVSGELTWRTFGPWRLPSTWPGGKLTPGLDGWKNSALDLSARVEHLWLGQGATDVTPQGTTSVGAAIRWYSSWGIAASVGGYGYFFDTPPIEIADRRLSWVVLARVSTAIR